MKAPKCKLCGVEHYSYEAHVFATNAATNTATNKATNTKKAATNSATNAGRGAAVVAVPEKVGLDAPVRGHAGGRTVNRRAKADYNAYQRDYMKKRRAVNPKA